VCLANMTAESPKANVRLCASAGFGVPLQSRAGANVTSSQASGHLVGSPPAETALMGSLTTICPAQRFVTDGSMTVPSGATTTAPGRPWSGVRVSVGQVGQRTSSSASGHTSQAGGPLKPSRAAPVVCATSLPTSMPPSSRNLSPVRRTSSPTRSPPSLVSPHQQVSRERSGSISGTVPATPRGGAGMTSPRVQDIATLKAVRAEVESGLAPLRQELLQLCESMALRMEAVENQVEQVATSLHQRLSNLEALDERGST